jgi:dTDP-4-amino-4,6-dideoxygalactose transaminase
MVRQISVGAIEITKEDKRLVNQVLDSNRLSYGKMTRLFEQKFAKLHDSKYAVFTNSGTSSLQIALQAMKEYYKWEDGDEVIVPATTFVATANIVLYNRMKPVFVDVDSKTFNINPDLIEEKITSRTKAIIPVHLLGLPAEMGRIMEIAKKHKLRVLEDSAECMFASCKRQEGGLLWRCWMLLHLCCPLHSHRGRRPLHHLKSRTCGHNEEPCKPREGFHIHKHRR